MTESLAPHAPETFPTPLPSQAPRWNTPAGPVWIMEPDDGTGPLRVRALAGAPGLLKVGATLRYNSIAGHPRLQVPTHWWRSGDQTWTSLPLPDGAPLDAERPPRPTWTEAVEALTPLAVALKDAHRRGLVHGTLAPWNVFYHPLTHRLTAVDFGLWSMEPLEAGPFCAPEMAGPPESRQPLPASDIHNLARVLIHFALSPEEAFRATPNFETIPAYAISTLERSIQPDPSRRPQTIEEFLAGLTFGGSVATSAALSKPGVSSPGSSRPQSGNRRGRVRQLETFENERRGEGIRFRLDQAEENNSQGVFVYRDQAPLVFESLQHLWEGAELNLIAPRIIEDSSGTQFLTSGDQTLPVLEPHWPISVTDVLKARGCPQRVLVDMRDPGERTHHLAFGSLVHSFLEDLTADETLSFDDVAARRLPDLHLDFLAAGVDDEALSELVEQGRIHFENLRRFTGRRTARASGRDRVGWCGEHVEATRYSTNYGLEGRTDLVVTDPRQGLQIIELKSGKPWHDHAGQVQSYALLWEELAAAEGMSASGYLLYSKTGEMKEVRLDEEDGKFPLIHGRNALVALFHSFVDPNSDFRAPHYLEYPKLCRQNACRFRKDRCKAQDQVLGLSDETQISKRVWTGVDSDLVRRARYYHGHLTRLIEMERWSDHAELGTIFQPARLAERIADGAAASDLTLTAGDGPELATLHGENLHIFTPGDRLLVHRGDINATHLFRARIVDRDANLQQDSVTLKLYSGQISSDLPDSGWIVDKMPARLGYRTAHRALYRVMENALPTILEVLLRPQLQEESTADLIDDDATLHPATAALLNDSQIQALNDALQHRRPATLIQGPPGTGKTTVIAHLSLELAARKRSVLLAALTNTAVDTMLVQVLDAAKARGEEPPPFLRLGSAHKSPLLAKNLRDRGLDPAKFFADDLGRDATSLKALARRLNEAKIVATTAHSALRHPVMTYLERHRQQPAFDVALIDEASQLTEPMALAPISSASRFVLVGDHRQLPPIVTSEQALTAFLRPIDASDEQENSNSSLATALLEAGLGGLDQSLFERLAAFLTPRLLTTQYRMHRSIMRFPAHQFYDGRLIAHPSVAEHHLDCRGEEIPETLSSQHPVVFVDVDGQEVGRTNPAEARAVLQTASHLLNLSPEASLGVLSPFRAQVHLLRRLRGEFDLPQLFDIDTVERFQGNERDAILVSLVKTLRPGDFLADTRRLNVALTRARKKLIIFGSRSCLEQDPTFRQWLSSSETVVLSWKL